MPCSSTVTRLRCKLPLQGSCFCVKTHRTARLGAHNATTETVQVRSEKGSPEKQCPVLHIQEGGVPLAALRWKTRLSAVPQVPGARGGGAGGAPSQVHSPETSPLSPASAGLPPSPAAVGSAAPPSGGAAAPAPALAGPGPQSPGRVRDRMLLSQPIVMPSLFFCLSFQKLKQNSKGGGHGALRLPEGDFLEATS